MLNDFQTFGYRDLVVAPREMRALYKALDDKLSSSTKTVGHLLTLNLHSLPERLSANNEEIIRIATGSYWGLWKCITRNEIEWQFSRIQAIKLRAALLRAILKKKRTQITVTRPWLDALPMI